MAELNMKKAIRRYNSIVGDIGYEHLQIGTRFSEDTENWNLRDMVAECDYVLSCYYESGHCNGDMRYSNDPEERKMWKSETGRLKRFIEAFEPFIGDMVCTGVHCSRFDNVPDSIIRR